MILGYPNFGKPSNEGSSTIFWTNRSHCTPPKLDLPFVAANAPTSAVNNHAAGAQAVPNLQGDGEKNLRISNFSVWFHAPKSKTTIRYKNNDDMLRWPGITRSKNTTTTTPSGLNGVPRPLKSSNMFVFKTDNTNTHINCI